MRGASSRATPVTLQSKESFALRRSAWLIFIGLSAIFGCDILGRCANQGKRAAELRCEWVLLCADVSRLWCAVAAGGQLGRPGQGRAWAGADRLAVLQRVRCLPDGPALPLINRPEAGGAHTGRSVWPKFLVEVSGRSVFRIVQRADRKVPV